MRKTELHSVLSAPDGIPRNEGLMKTDSPVHPVILSKRSHLLEMTLPFSPLGACEVFFAKSLGAKSFSEPWKFQSASSATRNEVERGWREATATKWQICG